MYYIAQGTRANLTALGIGNMPELLNRKNSLYERIYLSD